MLKRFVIATLVLLTLPIAAIVVLTGYHAVVNNFCPAGSTISTPGAAIAAAKSYVAGRRPFTFEHRLSSQDFLRRLEEHENCCVASSVFSLGHLADVWSVMFDIREDYTTFSVFVRMTRCGLVFDWGRMSWRSYHNQDK